MTSYEQISKDRYKLLTSRYEKYAYNLDKPELEPIRVFDPLSKKQIEELELIREVSLDLQKKKEEDKAAQLAKQQAAEEEAEAASKANDAPEEAQKEGEEKTE